MKVVASNRVLCNDGTYGITNGAEAPCHSAGGVKGQAPIKNRDSISKSLFKKIAGSYNQNLIIAGVLVAGYFAYKKFKK